MTTRNRRTEQRKHPRTPTSSSVPFSFSRVEVPVSFSGAIEGEGAVVDLSIKGCKVQSDEQLEPGDHLSLTFRQPRRQSAISIELGRVRWVKKNIAGVEFLSLWPADEERLTQFIRSIQEAQK